MLTFFNDSPAREFMFLSLAINGAKAGFGLIILCPSDLANLYPLPVDPVCGYDLPPVAIISFLAKIVFDLLITLNKLFLVTSLTTLQSK